jgi:hypothetical protein
MSAIGPLGGARHGETSELPGDEAAAPGEAPAAAVSRTPRTAGPGGVYGVDGAKGAVATDPLLMPAEIVAFEKKSMWGMHHLEWHIERRWDSFVADPKNAAFAKKHGWTKAPRQEGDPGNGMDFLAMHRAMIRTLTKQFPQDASYFTGWTTPPIDPKDPKNPAPPGTGPMDPKALKPIDTLTHLDQHLADFPTDDDLGRFIETSLGPAMDPKLGMQGLHNYLHNRFSDPKSKIDLGDPTVNIQNQMFWRLHGWIDQVWTRYRALKGEKETDPAYAKALQDASKMMNGPMHMGGTKGASEGGGATDEVPDRVRKFFETNP